MKQINTDLFFRFRSIDNLLGEYKELENQEIYFSSFEQLNDPMEGYKDIYWEGDEIVWKNFIKHYLICLEHTCELFTVGGEKVDITIDSIPIFKNFNHLPTKKYKKILSEIFKLFFNKPPFKEYPTLLSKKSKVIRRNELRFILKSLHWYAIDIIYTVYGKYGLSPKISNVDSIHNFIKKFAVDNNLLKLIELVDKEYPNNDTAIETLFSIQSLAFDQIELIIRCNNNLLDSHKNRMFLFSDFTDLYLQAIEKLIYTKCYAACFMSEYSNSSVWGHYGDNHKGACLIFKGNKNADSIYHLQLNKPDRIDYEHRTYSKCKCNFNKIKYENKFQEIDFFSNLGTIPRQDLIKYWYTSDEGIISKCSAEILNSDQTWKEIYWNNFYKSVNSKSNDWDYENEYRLLLFSFLSDLNDPLSRKLQYDFHDLYGIIFGIKTSTENKLKIMKIIEEKCLYHKRNDFKFFQANYSHKHGNIEINELGLLKINS